MKKPYVTIAATAVLCLMLLVGTAMNASAAPVKKQSTTPAQIKEINLETLNIDLSRGSNPLIKTTAKPFYNVTRKFTFQQKSGDGIERYATINEKKDGSNIVKTITLRGQNNNNSYFVDFPTNSTYKGCGVKASQIFIKWFGYDWTQGQINDYIETTNMTKYIPGVKDTSIFTTPAQLDDGTQQIMNKNFAGYKVVRSNATNKDSVVPMIESFLSHGYPVYILMNDGAHWQIIYYSTVKRDAKGKILDACFGTLDNGGFHMLTWSKLNYKFSSSQEKWAKLARTAGYTSYKETLISILHEEPTFTEQWTSGWSTSKVFQTIDQNYLFLLKEGNGKVHIHKLTQEGAVGQQIAEYDWTAGWTDAQFINNVSGTFMTILKGSSGLLKIHKITNEGQVGDLVLEKTFSGYKYMTSYMKGNMSYLLLFKSDGTLCTLKLGEDGRILSEEIQKLSIKGERIRIFSINEKQYLFILKPSTGKGGIFALHEDAQASLVQSFDWSSAWTEAQFFNTGGKTWMFIHKGFGDADGIARIHMMNEDGTIGKLVEDAYWQAKAYPMIADFGYSDIAFFKATEQHVYLFGVRTVDGMVKILKMNQDGTIQSDYVEIERTISQ